MQRFKSLLTRFRIRYRWAFILACVVSGIVVILGVAELTHICLALALEQVLENVVSFTISE